MTEKKLSKMRQNPNDWKIDDLKTIANTFGIEYKQNSGSHCVFRSPFGEHLTVPAHRPIKPIYIKKFIAFIETIKKGEGHEGTD